jgi:hypothetical protein
MVYEYEIGADPARLIRDRFRDVERHEDALDIRASHVYLHAVVVPIQGPLRRRYTLYVLYELYAFNRHRFLL